MIEITRIDEGFGRWDELLALILSSFAYMDGVIDPPSSAHLLTLMSLAQKASDEIAFAALEDDKLVGCVFCKPEPAFLYIGKFAISPAHQGKGIGRKLLSIAEEVAQEKSCQRSGSKPASSLSEIARPSHAGDSRRRQRIRMPALPASPLSRCRSGLADFSCGLEAPGSAGGGRRRKCGC